MRSRKIAPSIMCAPMLRVETCVEELEKNNIDLIHIDIMDGSFVPNYTLGTNFVSQLKEMTDIPLDIHLMIDAPENKLDWFTFGKGDYVSVHYESTRQLHRAIGKIRQRGAKAMVALNPATPLCVLEDILDDIDAVLLMTVNPGFAGQQLIESTLKKISKLRKMLDDSGHFHIEIEVDGNVSFVNAAKMAASGADIFVAGSSSVFFNQAPLSENIAKLRKIIG